VKLVVKNHAKEYVYLRTGKTSRWSFSVLFVYLFIFSLFNVAVINSDYMTSNVRMLSEQDKEMLGRGIFIA
jgi:hypothetical protein